MTPVTWTEFIVDQAPELWLRTGEHLILTGVSTGLAILAGVPLGIVAARVARIRGFLLGTVGILQTIPSLAMLAILLALLQKIGAVPAIVALTLYALLPIVRNTLAGLEGVSPRIMEAARGVGMTMRQQLWMVQLPLAVPVILAGIRTAAVVGVGIATLSAFIGAGGLGQFINRGLALSNARLILLGAVPAALLALFVDFTLGAAEWGFKPLKQAERAGLRGKLRPLALGMPLILVLMGLGAFFTGRPTGDLADGGVKPVRVACKNFTEQLILGELMAQLIEAKGIPVERKFNLGGTMICHGALVKGEVDLYAEYTGTGLTAILKRPVVSDPDKAFDVVRRGYRRGFKLIWLEPFGFNNTYAITVRRKDAASAGWRKISDLASRAGALRAGFTAEFSVREDGYPGLHAAYGFMFGEVRDLDPAIMYDAIAKNEVDVICAFATDGRIAAYDLKVLEDDRKFFPPYYAAPVVRATVLEAQPALAEALKPLAGLLDDAAMQRLNYAVDNDKRKPGNVAREFLRKCGLL